LARPTGVSQFAPDRLVLERMPARGSESRDSPRVAFAGHVNETPWDRFHAAYFSGYALWTYLTHPFLYAYPGFLVAEEIPHGRRNGENLAPVESDFSGQRRQP